MNTVHTRPPRRKLLSYMLFAGFAFVSPSLYAQTFAGRDYLAESPANFRAFVYPAQRTPAINIRIENRSARAVRIQIKNEAQQTIYDDYVSKQKFAGRFNVAALPYGTYTVELTNRTARYRQAFRIEQLKAEHIVMITQPMESDSLLAKH